MSEAVQLTLVTGHFMHNRGIWMSAAENFFTRQTQCDIPVIPV
jgi:hypothetical protein